MAGALCLLPYGGGASGERHSHAELKVVRGKLARRAEDWRSSSARAHVDGWPDGRLTDLEPLTGLHRHWRAMLRHRVEAGDISDDAVGAIEVHKRTGRPRVDEAFVERLEAKTGRRLAKTEARTEAPSELNIVSL
jgi:putative transposase